MRDYYLLINGEQVGPYKAGQLYGFLADGQLNQESQAWYEGLPDWQPLGTILEPMATDEPRQVPIQQTIAEPQTFVSQAAAPSPKLFQAGIVQTNVKQGALLGGVVCLLVGLTFMYFTLFSFIIYGALFLAAFILSIVAMAQGRIGGGVILLLMTIIVPLVFGFLLFAVRATALLNQISHDSMKSEQNQTQNGSLDQPDNPSIGLGTPTTTSSSDSTNTVSQGTIPIVKPTVTLSKHPALDAKLGFRTFKLGSPFSNFNPEDLDAESFFEKSDTKPFGVKVFDKQMGAGEIDSIQLNFNQELLQSIRVSVKGKQSSLALRESLISAYGQPDETTDLFAKTLTWNGEDCTITLDSEAIGEGSVAVFSSKSVDAKIESITEQKAKAGAASGAQNL